MIPWLVKHQGVSHQEAAEHFNISRAQLIQDLMLLTVTGIGQYANQQFDVDYENDRIYVRDGLGLDRPFTFDSTEASCLLLGIQALESIPEAVSGVNPNDLQMVRQKLQMAFPIESGINVINSDFDKELALIGEAISTKKMLEFDYWNDARDDLTSRLVAPFRLHTINQISKLDAYDSQRGWRTYRVSNMKNIRLSKSVFTETSQSFQEMNTFEVDIAVPSSSLHLLENFSVLKRKSNKDNTTNATILISQTNWLARQVLASGCTITILNPQNVAEEVTKFINNARSAYPRPTGSK